MGPRLLNTSPLVVKKVTLQRDDNAATQMLVPSVRSTSAGLSLTLKTHIGVLALQDNIGQLALSYATDIPHAEQKRIQVQLRTRGGQLLMSCLSSGLGRGARCP